MIVRRLSPAARLAGGAAAAAFARADAEDAAAAAKALEISGGRERTQAEIAAAAQRRAMVEKAILERFGEEA